MGQMTGRGAGYCAGFATPGYANPAVGRGFAAGRGFAGGGHGRRNCFYTTGMPGWMRFGGYAMPGPFTGQAGSAMERQNLKAQADALEAELSIVRKRLNDLEESE